MTDKSIDITIPKTYYWNYDLIDPSNCPRCLSKLRTEHLSYYLIVNRHIYSDREEFIIGNNNGLICPNCPTIVLDYDFIQDKFFKNYEEPIEYFDIVGLVDTASMSNNPNDTTNVIPFKKIINDQLLILKRYNEKEAEYRKNKKIGRNDPCPCGSGLKYKKCCLRKETRKPKENKAKNSLLKLSEKEIELLLEKKISNNSRLKIFDHLQARFAIKPDNEYILKIFIKEILLKNTCSTIAAESLRENYEQQDDVTNTELKVIKELLPEIFVVMKENPNNKIHPFRAIISTLCMNNLNEIDDFIDDIIEVFIKTRVENRYYYSHLLIDIANYNTTFLLPILDEIINIGIYLENVLIILSLIAEKYPEKVIDLVPSIIDEPKNIGKYFTYRFLTELSIRKPESIRPYYEKLKEEKKLITDIIAKEELEKCLSSLSQLSDV